MKMILNSTTYIWAVFCDFASAMLRTPEEHIMHGCSNDPKDIANRKLLISRMRKLPNY